MTAPTSPECRHCGDMIWRRDDDPETWVDVNGLQSCAPHATVHEPRKGHASDRHPVVLGDIFVSSWGYDQTNVEFWQVTEVLPASVRVMQIPADEAEGSDSLVTARPDAFMGEEHTKRVMPSIGEAVYIKSPVHGNAYPWNGKPRHRTPWYAGH